MPVRKNTSICRSLSCTSRAHPLERTNLIDRRSHRPRALEARLQDLHAAPLERGRPSCRRSPRNCARSDTCRAARRRSLTTPRPTIPKNLFELDGWIQQGIEAWQLGRHDEANAIDQRVIQRSTMPIWYWNRRPQRQSGDAAGAIRTPSALFMRMLSSLNYDTAWLLPGRSGAACGRYRVARARCAGIADESRRLERPRNRVCASGPRGASGPSSSER